jgi:hypothetical protein
MREHILLHVGNSTFVTQILRLFLNNYEFFSVRRDFSRPEAVIKKKVLCFLFILYRTPAVDLLYLIQSGKY